MSVYSVKGRGWRYDFTHKGERYTEAWFKTKTEAKTAEVEKRKELKNPQLEPAAPTDTDFLDLVNQRLDHVKAYNSSKHYSDYQAMAKRWTKLWGRRSCSEITTGDVKQHLLRRREVSAYTANQDLRCLRAAFNFGMNNNIITVNPTQGIRFFPVDRRRKYIPPKEDVVKAISVGNAEEQQYLWTIVLTAGRVSEINKLTWDDVDLNRRVVTLWTRKRKGGNREPRNVPMVSKLFEIMRDRHASRHPEMPWVFWHTYWDRKGRQWVSGPFKDRKSLMAKVCEKSSVKYFRYHALRHLTASILDDLGAQMGSIQKILGHKNRSTTEIYLHSIGDAERRAMESLENSEFLPPDLGLDRKDPTNMPLPYWNRRVARPSYEVLKVEVGDMGYAGTGRKYGVSDNAVRKWLKAYEREAKTSNPSRKKSHTDSHTAAVPKKKGLPN